MSAGFPANAGYTSQASLRGEATPVNYQKLIIASQTGIRLKCLPEIPESPLTSFGIVTVTM